MVGLSEVEPLSWVELEGSGERDALALWLPEREVPAL